MIRVRKLGFKFQLGLIYRENWTGIWFTQYCIKFAMHGSPWRCIRLSLPLDKPCNICFLPWVGKVINTDLFRLKFFGCLTRVVHKSLWTKLKLKLTQLSPMAAYCRQVLLSVGADRIFCWLLRGHQWWWVQAQLLYSSTDASPLFSCPNIFHFSMFFKNYSMVKWACDIYYNASLFSFLSSTMMSGLLCSILLSCWLQFWIGKFYSTYIPPTRNYSGCGSNQNQTFDIVSSERMFQPDRVSNLCILQGWANFLHSCQLQLD